MGFELVGKVWDAQGFLEYVNTLNLEWVEGITMHHTSSPSLAQRPRGLTIQHIRNIQDYYKNTLGWSSGPHLFVDDDEIFGMSSLEKRGIHAVSFNKDHIGIEVLGDYDIEDPYTGRGKDCWNTAKDAVRILLDHAGLEPDNINGHRDDPRTSKSCPGNLMNLDNFRTGLEPRDSPDISNQAVAVESQSTDKLRLEFKERLDNIQWQLNKLKDIAL